MSVALNLTIVTVQVVYPGAGAQPVEEQVTREVEDAVDGPGDIKKLTSVSRTGRSTVTVEFREGIDVDVAAADVQHASAVSSTSYRPRLRSRVT